MKQRLELKVTNAWFMNAHSRSGRGLTSVVQGRVSLHAGVDFDQLNLRVRNSLCSTKIQLIMRKNMCVAANVTWSHHKVKGLNGKFRGLEPK